ncbi:Spindle and kinetochore-associated protein 1 [Borealophlyctis nickersoniae]|nr:Spindle and kinetochore-associated protein 1 [Borealophlyctis nickersoniae]
MDALLEAYTQRVSTLKTLAQLRSNTLNSPFDLNELASAVSDLERRVSVARDRVDQDLAALNKGAALENELDLIIKALTHMANNVPKHLPMSTGNGSHRPGTGRKLVPAKSEPRERGEEPGEGENMYEKSSASTQRNVGLRERVLGVSQIGNRAFVDQNGGVDTDSETAGDGGGADMVAEKKPKMVVTLAPITVAEFESLPKYLVGRLTRDRLNDSLAELSALIRDKHALLRMPHAQMKKSERDTYWEHKRSATQETKGKAFVTEKDIREKKGWSTSAFKLDPQGRTVVAIARHLGRLKEVRGGGHTRLVVL